MFSIFKKRKKNKSLITPVTQASRPSTASEQVYILAEDFDMPQLGRKRRIWIYLPPDYHSSHKRYPVLYMQDGQNIFDEATAFSGEWGVDKTLNYLFAQKKSLGVIVVAIDNGGEYRLKEYAPWKQHKLGGGEGLKYAKFLVNTLKPYIDQHFRTLIDRENTGLMGSSLGGLIVFYIALKFPKIFGKIGVFSPSFWFTPKVYDFANEYEKKCSSQFYFLAGVQESKSLVPDTQKMVELMRQKGFTEDELKLIIRQDGTHSEWFWRREFAEAFLWLFAQKEKTEKS